MSLSSSFIAASVLLTSNPQAPIEGGARVLVRVDLAQLKDDAGRTVALSGAQFWLGLDDALWAVRPLANEPRPVARSRVNALRVLSFELENLSNAPQTFSDAKLQILGTPLAPRSATMGLPPRETLTQSTLIEAINSQNEPLTVETTPLPERMPRVASAGSVALSGNRVLEAEELREFLAVTGNLAADAYLELPVLGAAYGLHVTNDTTGAGRLFVQKDGGQTATEIVRGQTVRVVVSPSVVSP